MKNIIYTLLTACIVASCADVPEEYSDTSTLSKTNDLQYIDIANAKSLYISSSTGRATSREKNGDAKNKLFKITDEGGVEEVEYKDGDNKTFTIINYPIAVDVVDTNYLVFSFGSSVDNLNSCYLTNKETGTVYVLGKTLNDNPSQSKCPLPQESRDKKILTDGKGNLYYRYYGGEDGSRYSIRQVNYSNPENIVATQYTDDDESIENFVVDSKGNVAYNTLPREGTKIFWIGFDGEIKYNDTDVNLTSGHYKLYQDDKLIIFDPMGNDKYIIDNGEELVTKELTNSLLIDFLLEIKCKHTFECLTQ